MISRLFKSFTNTRYKHWTFSRPKTQRKPVEEAEN